MRPGSELRSAEAFHHSSNSKQRRSRFMSPMLGEIDGVRVRATSGGNSSRKRLRSEMFCGRMRAAIRVMDLKVSLKRFWRWMNGENPCSGMLDALAHSQAALTERLEAAEARITELQANHDKQLADLRNVIAHLNDPSKPKSSVARSFAEVRQFIGDDDAS